MPLPHGDRPSSPAVLHATLTAGFSVILAVFAFVRFSGTAFTTGPDELEGLVGIAATGLSIINLLIGVLFLRGRVPPRVTSQAVEAYWEVPANRQAALMLWVVLEGGGIMGAVGWLLTGNLVALMAALAALGAMIMFSPARLAGR